MCIINNMYYQFNVLLKYIIIGLVYNNLTIIKVTKRKLVE